MNPQLQQRIDRLAKSTQNVVNARNAAQRSAAEKFLVQRAHELTTERDQLRSWLQEADDYINSEMPGINHDPDDEYNREWIERLNDYTAICTALDNAWNAYMGTKEQAA